LTLEAIALKKSTLMILDERLYRKDYDVDLEFLTRTSKNYLKIPASGYYISKDEIINLVELQILLAHRLTDVKIHEYSDALVRSGQEPRMFMWTRFESQIFPPQGDNRQFAIAAITSTIASLADADDSVFREDASHREDFLSDLGFITFAYRNILNRDPDLDGIISYADLLGRAERNGDGRRQALMRILRILATSSEARALLSLAGRSNPFARVLAAA
jgi:hypothetical protein